MISMIFFLKKKASKLLVSNFGMKIDCLLYKKNGLLFAIREK